MAQYKQERAAVMRKIEELEELERQQQLTEADRVRLQRLQQEKQSLLDLINKLLEEKLMLLRSAGESLASGEIVVHVKTGRKEKRVEVATTNGKVSLLPLEQSLNVCFERIAVTGSLTNGDHATKPEFKEFNNYTMAVQPGQELIVQAKPTGGNWLVRAMGL